MSTYHLPPGPRGNFLLGTLKDFRRNPQRFLLSLAQEYGDVVRYRNAFWSTYLFTHPDQVKHILQENSRNYSKDTLNWKTLKPAFGEGLLTSDGPLWLRQRRLMQPAFHQRRVIEFTTLMTEATTKMLERWEPIAQRGEAIDVSAEMMKVTLEIIGKALFSSDIRGEARPIGEAVTGILDYFQHQVTTSIPLPLMVPTSANRRFQAAMRKVREVVDRVIAERESRSEWPDDLLSMLMSARDEETQEGMTRQQLYDELITMIFSGYETTATALSWAWYLLSTHPEIMARLRSELKTVLDGKPPVYEDLPKLNYTCMVIQETIRLLPPVWLVTRKAIAEDEIDGYHVPANTVVTLSPYVTHRRKDFWENPEGFDPERFLPERIGNLPRYAYFPFGGGPRQCIGNTFAMIEAQLILATVAQRYRLDLVPGHPIEPLPFGILRPRYGILVTVRNGS